MFEWGSDLAAFVAVGVLASLATGTLLARLRFARFGVVGVSGLVVNTLVLALMTDVVGLFYVVSAVIATQASTLWNFCFTEAWVLR